MKIHTWTNYITGTELESGKLLLYGGKTRAGMDQRKLGRMAGINGYLFDTIHANPNTKNDKLTEQRHINTIRAVAELLPDVIEVGNINNDGFYGDVSSISQAAFNKIVAWVQGTRTMTEKRMVANKRKLARKLAQVKRARTANKATA